MPTDKELQEILSQTLQARDSLSVRGSDTAKQLFGLRQIDEELAELMTAEQMATRGSDEVHRFTSSEISISVSTEAGRVHLIVSPSNVAASLESANKNTPISLDEAGSGSIEAAGPVRIRLTRVDGSHVVTDPIMVQRP